MAKITLSNGCWGDGVNVDVVIGNYEDCNNNRKYGTQLVPLGSRWEIEAGTEDICYRRDPDPDNPKPGSWTQWVKVSNLDKDQTVDLCMLRKRPKNPRQKQ
jgi:hypothetical protein